MTTNSEGKLPGEDIVNQGLDDLAKNQITDFALLVLIASPRLRQFGFEIKDRPELLPYEHTLYDKLSKRLGNDAHSHYNSLIRRIVSYSHARERENSMRDSSSNQIRSK